MFSNSNATSRRDFTRSLLLGANAAAIGIVGGSLWADPDEPAGPTMPSKRADRAFPGDLKAKELDKPNIVLIVLDTVRADHLSCYGYTRKTTPNIDKFAAKARLYDNAMSPAYWTLPSHASLFTGLPASAHGATQDWPVLDPRIPSLPEQLQHAGYQTVGVTTNPWFAGRVNRFDRGFDTFEEPGTIDGAFLVVDRLAQWFHDQYNPERPFFLFANIIDAHAPYKSRIQKFAATNNVHRGIVTSRLHELVLKRLVQGRLLEEELLQSLRDLYDDEILRLDSQLGKFFDFLESSGISQNSLSIVTSDHGELFGEHRLLGHRWSLYEPLTKVPLIVRFPGRLDVGREEQLVQSHDVYATALAAAGAGTPLGTSQSLLVPSADRLAVSEELVPFPTPELVSKRGLDLRWFTMKRRAVRRGNWKLILSDGGADELYDLGKDPREIQNLAGDQSKTVAMLKSDLEKWQGSFEHYSAPSLDQLDAAPQTATPITPKQAEAARGLGYVD